MIRLFVIGAERSSRPVRNARGLIRDAGLQSLKAIIFDRPSGNVAASLAIEAGDE